MSIFPVRANEVRYIKLGERGEWEARCRAEGIIRFGFDSADADSIAMCREGRWDDMTAAWHAAAKSKSSGSTSANEVRRFWTDPGDILWITFVGEDLCWGFLEPGEPQPYAPNDPKDSSTFRRVRGGWRSVDANDGRLGKSNLPGYVTKVVGYRGTACSVEGWQRLIERINGVVSADSEKVVAARAALKDAIVPLIQRLNSGDMEVLVDMMFSRAGWRRIGRIGGNQRDKDLDLEMPLTGETAVVQIKTQTGADEIADYVQRKAEMLSYKRMFFCFHTLKGRKQPIVDPGVTLMDAAGIADRVVELGLVDWVINRAY